MVEPKVPELDLHSFDYVLYIDPDQHIRFDIRIREDTLPHQQRIYRQLGQ